jgi:hypothetical protein
MDLIHTIVQALMEVRDAPPKRRREETFGSLIEVQLLAFAAPSARRRPSS